MTRSKHAGSSLDWEITVLEWEIGSSELNYPATKSWHHQLFEKILRSDVISRIISLFKMIWRFVTEDPRKILHGMKVGLSLILVSLFLFVTPLFNSSGGEAVWAIMTVVVIFEFTAGATLYKGINRIFATFLGGLLAFALNSVAILAGHQLEPFIIAFGVFIFGTLATFARFFPKINAGFDYGFMIFILTFSFIAVSGFRATSLWDLFQESGRRVETILIGCAISILVSTLICPMWAGDDLHNLIIGNLEGLAGSLEGSVTAYFKQSSNKDSDNDTLSIGYTRALNSKAREELLAKFAVWEFPAHGQFRFRYPWRQYVKIGANLRCCAYCIEALNGCMNSEIQAPYFLRQRLKVPSINIVAESTQIILELADSIKTMTRISSVQVMTDRLNRAVEILQNCLTSQPELFLDSKTWQIVKETPQQTLVDFKATPPFESISPRILRIKKAAGRADEANKKPTRSSSTKIYPDQENIPFRSDDGINQVQKYERTQGAQAFMETLSLATVACLLTKIVTRLKAVIISVDELGERANFIIVDDKPIVDDNNNAAEKIPPTSQSQFPPQAILVPHQPERPVGSNRVKD